MKTADQVQETKASGYRPREIYESNAGLREVIDGLTSGTFSRGDKELFRPLINSLLDSDSYLLFADYQSYIEAQDSVDRAYADHDHWRKMSILNAARMGKFSSDRAIEEYCSKIWKVTEISGLGD
jgi:starch phosphorylase